MLKTPEQLPPPEPDRSIGDTIERLEGGNTVNAAANTDGIMPPPMNPWKAR